MKEQPGYSSGGQKKLFFGNYDLVRRIDVGGMGEVYMARQRTAFGREVAIKIIRPDLVYDKVARQRFLREAEVNAKLLHEHIPSFIEFGEEQGQLFFVTPFIAGGTLAQQLQAGPMKLSEIYQLFTALLRAVAYIHRHGVVHRDLKPSNILLDTEMEPGQVYVRLIDFGISSDVGMTSADPRLTQAGTEMGTVEYMAPERLSGISAPSNDIYSLGVILYQMLTGQLPSKQPIALPAPLEYVVSRATARKPEDRFASAEEMLVTFENAYKYLNVPRGQQEPLQAAFSSSFAPDFVSKPDSAGIPTPVRVGTTPPGGRLKQEVKALHDSGDVPLVKAQPRSASSFGHDDYAAPTINIGNMVHLPVQAARATTSADQTVSIINPAPPRPPKRRRSPLLAVVTVFIVCVLLALAGVFYFEFQAGALATATVNFGPKVEEISQVYHLKASLSQTTIDERTQTIPLSTLHDSQGGSQTGQTTGKECLIPPVFFCHQVVSSNDVDTLSAQEQQNLDKIIAQNLQQQLKTKQGTLVGTVQYIDATPVANPAIGTASKTVTVTINGQQGTETYFLNSDAQALAQELVTRQIQQLGAGYQLVSGSMQVGTPAIEGIDSNGQVLIAVAAGAVAQYHFPNTQLQHIASAITNMKQAAALAYIKRQPGIDPGTVSISVSEGNTLPGNSRSIKIVPINPANIPAVTLPQVTPENTPGA
jgi:serine/threonine protein kinase